MNRKKFIRQTVAIALIAAAVVTYVISALVGTGRSDVNTAAEEMSRKVEFRMALLDGYIQQALEGDHSAWLDLRGLPEDMVVYRYVEDSLQSWINQFPLRNDDIHLRTLVQRLGDTRSSVASPLEDASAQVGFMNYGPKMVSGQGRRRQSLQSDRRSGDCERTRFRCQPPFPRQ